MVVSVSNLLPALLYVYRRKYYKIGFGSPYQHTARFDIVDNKVAIVLVCNSDAPQNGSTNSINAWNESNNKASMSLPFNIIWECEESGGFAMSIDSSMPAYNGEVSTINPSSLNGDLPFNANNILEAILPARTLKANGSIENYQFENIWIGDRTIEGYYLFSVIAKVSAKTEVNNGQETVVIRKPKVKYKFSNGETRVAEADASITNPYPGASAVATWIAKIALVGE